MTPANTDVRQHPNRRRVAIIAGAAIAVTGVAAIPAFAQARSGDEAPVTPPTTVAAAAAANAPQATPAEQPVTPDPAAEFAAKWAASTPEEQLAFKLFTATPEELAAFTTYVTPPPPPQPAAKAKVTTKQAPKQATGRQSANVSGGGGGGGFLGCVRGRESRGNYGAVNGGSGAAGAYQFMPQTWNNTARHAGRPDLVGQNPASVSAADQDAMAQHLYSWQGSAPWGGGC